MNIELKVKAISANQCWQGRKYKTKAYSAWREELQWLLKGKKGLVADSYDLEIDIYTPEAKRSDIDNFCKPLIDSLVENRIITDDRKIDSLRVRKFKGDYRICINIKKYANKNI